jgi:23S rRNA (adenine2503-C2)-methyltransferase
LENELQNKIDIKSLLLSELEEYMESIGDKKFRAKQIYDWLHNKLVSSYDEMTNLSKKLIERLEKDTELINLEVVDKKVSEIDGTAKFLFKLKDGNIIESVLMKYKHGNSVCISSQVGCSMGCKFCASTIGGRIRNLSPSEFLDQIYKIQKLTGERVSNVVIMGSGEPFDNFDNFIRFLDLIVSENGLNISQRNITVSTCGLVDKIYKLADMKPQLTLAISLHATTDEKRRELMPIANKYSISEILEACEYFLDKSNRRITFEYSLVQGVNDNIDDAKALSKLLKGMLCHVNLIPINPIKERSYARTQNEQVNAFRNCLEKHGINATIRREMGQDIQAACGQLRKSYIENV